MPDGASKIRIRCVVNGKPLESETYPMARLLDLIREQWKLTGTKEGCGEGECGACAVELNGELVNSCLVPALHAQAANIRTIEGVGHTGRLASIQQSFLQHGGAQCGICTPGMILAAVNLLERHPHLTELQVREGLAGNLCRCTGYIKIFESVLEACREAGPSR